MSFKLPFLAYILIGVGLFLGGAAYLQFSSAPLQEPVLEEETALVDEQESEGEESENELEEEGPAEPPTTTTPSKPAPAEDDGTYSMTEVRTHTSASSCWTVINGKVYDLTSWISRHPGGKSAITGLCGKDGTASFESEHEGDSKAESRLSSFLLGPLAP